jgi:arsenate reductase (thioredoxin)
MTRKRVLFLCTGNSCRSQIAEAIVNTFMGNDWEAYSAGTLPASHIHPNTVKVLAEIGIDWHDRTPKSAVEYRHAALDLVVTVCDDAEANCPVLLGAGHRVHLGFPDPAKVTGSEEVILGAFRHVRDDMRNKIPALLLSQP